MTANGTLRATEDTSRDTSRGQPAVRAHVPHDERVSRGKQARVVTPLESQAEFVPEDSRDPVGLLVAQSTARVPELVPIRHGRMLASPFAYYRGAALPMTADLASTPVSGLQVQLCGDAHLANFGAFASPDRRLVFDINDFDETLPGPFEWDVKRLAASFAVAGRSNGFGARTRRAITVTVAETYRTAMRSFARQSRMQVWYARLDVEEALAEYRSEVRPKRFKAIQAMMAEARGRDSIQAMRKLTSVEGGHRRILSNPPTLVPVEELFGHVQSDRIYDNLRTVFGKYRRSLQSDRRRLLEQFEIVQVARKIVGVGSVGQRAWVLLLEDDDREPLFLQAKQAQASVLADYCGRSRHRNQGERVVAGQHLMQAASDIFLGWTNVVGEDDVDSHYYVRQLRDWKFSFPIEQMRKEGLTIYARLCAWTLARAHARSGDRAAVAAYLGRSTTFDHAIADFAETYADQNARDYTTFLEAARTGHIEAVTGI
jgi:uncharacterized protein (DUF2252 family)